MSSATIHLVSDIFAPGASYDFFIIPSKVVYDASSTIVHAGAGWDVLGASVACWDGNMEFSYDHGWGVQAPARTDPEDEDNGWSAQLGTLSFVFKDAAYKPSTNEFYNFKVEIIDAFAFNGDTTSERTIILVGLADKQQGAGTEAGFWIQSYQQLISPSQKQDTTAATAGTGTVRLSIVNSAGVEQPGTFLFPFADLDVRYDGTNPSDTSKDIPGQKYSEGAEITSGCTQIYALNGAVTQTSGCWLHLDSSTGPVSEFVANLDGHTYLYSNEKYHGLRFTNGYNWNDPYYPDTDPEEGLHTGIVGLFSTGATVRWTGSRCGTSLQGNGLLYAINYIKNPTSFITDASNMPDPNPQYAVKGSTVRLSTNVPVPIPDHSTSAGSSIRASFNSWNTNSSGSGTKYDPGAYYTVNGNLTLYAQWDFTYTYTIAFNMNTGYGIKGSDIVDGNIVYPDVAAGDTINLINEGWRFEKLGNDVVGWASTPTGSKKYDIDNTFVVQASATYYALWTIKSHTVRFHDGYTSGNDVIKTVTVTHGESVASGDIPVPGQTYSGRKFEKGGFYRFAGWSGSTSNILDNTDLVAMWEFIPIWVMKNGQWVKYHPTEP